eukprot:1460260-Pyramimonas_sp.AAC.1
MGKKAAAGKPAAAKKAAARGRPSTAAAGGEPSIMALDTIGVDVTTAGVNAPIWLRHKDPILD